MAQPNITLRSLTTRKNSITLDIPRHQKSKLFHTIIFDNYGISENVLIITVAEMAANLVATGKVSPVVETLYGKPVPMEKPQNEGSQAILRN